MGEATELDMKSKDSTEWIKSAEITTKLYKLTFCFDIETCLVFDIGKS